MSKLDRFLKVVTFGKYSSQDLLNTRKGKITTALVNLDGKVVDLEKLGLDQAAGFKAEAKSYRADLTRIENKARAANSWEKFRDACDELKPLKVVARRADQRATALLADVQQIKGDSTAAAAKKANRPLKYDDIKKELQSAQLELAAPRGAVGVDAIYKQMALLQARAQNLEDCRVALKAQLDRYTGDRTAAEFVNSAKAILDADAMGLALTRHINYLKTLAANHPFTEKTLFQAKALELTSGASLLKDAVAQAGDKLPAKTKKLLESAAEKLEARKAKMGERNGNFQVKDIKAVLGPKKKSKGDAEKNIKALLEKKGLAGLDGLPLTSAEINEERLTQLVLEYTLKKANLSDELKKKTGLGDLKNAVKEARVKARNNQNWEPIRKDVRITHGGEQVALKSEIKPASSLGKTFADLKNANGEACGVCSHDVKNYKHATNLASSELTKDGKTLFRGVRHGINASYGIRASGIKKMTDDEVSQMVTDLVPQDQWAKKANKADLAETVKKLKNPTSAEDKAWVARQARAMRKAANANRAKDVATAALLTNPGSMKKLADGKEPIEININSMSLVTPITVGKNPMAKGKADKQEGLMLENQMEAWRDLEGVTELEITQEDGTKKKVKVKINVNSFNFGVNAGVYGNLVGAGMMRGDAWTNSDRHNGPAIQKLLGKKADRTGADKFGGQVGDWVGEQELWLAQTKTGPKKNDPEVVKEVAEVEKKVKVVKQLAMQIGKIWDEAEYKDAGKEPYKIVSRLAVLTHLMGHDAAFNCKSGKDRTGQLDVEAKMLATQIELSPDGLVPDPDHEVDEAEAKNRAEMALNSGSLEMQQYNTGHMGFKLDGVEALDKGYGTSETADTFRGTSKYTSA
jgi:hypothetical protein